MNKKIRIYLLLLFVFSCFFCGACTKDNNGEGGDGGDGTEEPYVPGEVVDNEYLTIYPSPDGEILNKRYTVTANGSEVPCYNARVGVRDKTQREQAVDNPKVAANTYDVASIAYFDLKKGPVTVTVSIEQNIIAAEVLPASAGIVPQVDGKTVTFQVDKPQNLTVELNNDDVGSLHLFINPEETDKPDPNDPDVIYFGPGMHEVSAMEIGSNKTVYVAGGAFIRGKIVEGEVHSVNQSSGLDYYHKPNFLLKGDNITFRGRGIIDQTLCPTHARNIMQIYNCNNVKIEGVILHNSSTWTMDMRSCNNAKVDNVKIIGYRSNSDGIDICSSFDVIVQNCFIRTMDDLIVIKTPKGFDKAGRIVAKNCVLANELAHALSLGAEITQDVEDVLFTDCDIIHDRGREWSMRVYQTDKGLVKNVRFENIRIEEAKKLASLWIGKAKWSTDEEYGNIQDIIFKDITAKGSPLNIEFQGYDENHTVSNVTMENITLNGNPLNIDNIVSNEFVENVTLQ